MADLVTLAELKAFLGVTASADDALLQSILDAIEEQLETACGRELTPFSAAQPGRVEVLDGTGTDTLFVDYPVDTVSTIKVGTDPAAPLETLNPSDATVVEWVAGRTRIRRVDGKTWHCAGVPRAVRITYDAAADLPAAAALAVKRVVSVVYGQRGSEGLRSETTGGFYSYTREDTQSVVANDPIWSMAVAGSRRVPV